MVAQSQATQYVLSAINAIPSGERTPTFNEPWEAQAFAIVLSLHRRGLFTWGEWATALGAEISTAQAKGDPDNGDTYYHHWLAAIEGLIQQKGITNAQTLVRYQGAWHKAAERTPHGEQIVLTADDMV